MRSRVFWIVLLLLVPASCLVVPFFLQSAASGRLEVGAELTSAVASLATFAIALLLFDRYGIDRPLVEKSTQTVLNLLKNLKDVSFALESERPKFWIQVRLAWLSSVTDLHRDYRNRKLLFSLDYVECLEELWSLGEDLFLPRTISEKLKPLELNSLTYVSSEEGKDYLLVTVFAPSGKFRGAKMAEYGKLNSVDMTLGAFIDQWHLVINDSKRWLEERSAVPVDLNL
jgi:hypothetical protein